ncbi:MAG: murein biosynthesis integral membrane protein MurJ [Acidobacteriota bacterium]
MSTRRRLVGATGGMALVAVLSRVFGYARDKTLAALLGAGHVADAFYAGLAVPNMFRALLAEGALHAAFIPTLAEVKDHGGEEERRQFIRAMTSVLLMALPLLVGIGVIAARPLVGLFVPGLVRDPEGYALAVRLTRLMFPYLGLISLAALGQGVLNASDRFLLPAATPIAFNLCVIAGTVTAVELTHGGWDWLAVGVLCGGLAQLGLQWWGCWRIGLPLLPGRGAFHHPEVRRVLRLMLPGIPALGVYQLTLLVSYRFASSVSPGAVTARFNAARLAELIYGVLIVQLTTAVLPMLSAERVKDGESARRMLAFAVRLLSLVALPAAVFLGILAPKIVGTAFGGGRYDATDVAMTAGALAMYAWGIPFLGLTKLLASTSYAWKDTRQPVLAATVNLIGFYLLGVVWTPRFGVAGVAAAASAGQLLNSATLLVLNGRHGRLPHLRDVGPGLARQLIAAAVLGAGLLLVLPHLPSMGVTGVRSLALLAMLAAGAVVVYTAVLFALGAEELTEARALFRRRAR